MYYKLVFLLFLAASQILSLLVFIVWGGIQSEAETCEGIGNKNVVVLGGIAIQDHAAHVRAKCDGTL